MSNTFFMFKHFLINQSQSRLKVGTDGVLLGAWAKPDNSQNILDIGTGTGLIALMLAQKSEAIITAVEIDENACIDARNNFKISTWQHRLELKNVDFNLFSIQTIRKFDFIITNPPYFVNSLHSPDKLKNMARHACSLTHSQLLLGVNSLLTDDGDFYVVLPYDISRTFIIDARLQNLHPLEMLQVFSKSEDPVPKRTLIRFTRNDCKCSETKLSIYQAKTNDYTAEYKELTKDYYLNF